MSDAVDELLGSTPFLWKGCRSRVQSSAILPTGYRQLDCAFPGGGWPLGVVIELLTETIGIGELRLLLPAIQHLTQNQRQVLMINAPYVPYAPALLKAGLDLSYLPLLMPRDRRDALWAAEKALTNPACGMVLLWSGHLFNGTGVDENKAVRRLQVAAQVGRSLLVLYRCAERGRQNQQTPWAAVRLRLAAKNESLLVDLLKFRGLYKRLCIELDLTECMMTPRSA